MNDKMLFMIYNGEIKFLSNTNMDHREWYQSLGGDPNNYDNTIRGYVIKNQLIFFKGNLSYDNEVIDMARKCAPVMKQQLNNPDLKVCCGITPGMNGASWEPILTLNEDELTGFSINIQDEINKQVQAAQTPQTEQAQLNTEPILEFKNNFDDPQFIKTATIFTSVMLVITIISKILLYSNKKLDFNSSWNIFLVITQVALLILTIIGYRKKIKATKYFGLAASISLFFMFDLIDLILGIINTFFTIDQGYLVKALSIVKKDKKETK